MQQLCTRLAELAKESGGEVERLHEEMLASHCQEEVTAMRAELSSEVWQDYARCVHQAVDYVAATRDCADITLRALYPRDASAETSANTAPPIAIDAAAVDAQGRIDYAGAPLEAWELGTGTGPELSLRMRDLDARFLLWTLRPPSSVLALSSAGPLLSGYAKGASTALVQALEERIPEAGFAKAKPIRGKGRKVTIRFYGANTRDLLHLLADVGGINIVVAAAELPALDLAVEDTPWDGLLQSVATLLDLRIESQGNTYFLLAANETRAKALPGDKKKLDLLIDGPAPLGAIIELIATVSASQLASQSCDAPLSDLRLRRVDTQHLAQALALTSGQLISSGTSPCPPLQRLSPDDLESWQLVAAAEGKIAGALFRKEDQWGLLLVAGAHLSGSMNSLMLPEGDREIPLYPQEPEPRANYAELSPRGLLSIDEKNLLFAMSDQDLIVIEPLQWDDELSLVREGEALILSWVDVQDRTQPRRKLRFEIP